MNNLKKIRTEKGITQEDLAKMVGLTQSNISRIENDEVHTSISTAFAIANALECKVDELVKADKSS